MEVDRVFKSKVGWWYHLTLFIIAVSCIFVFVVSDSPFEIIPLLLVMVLCVHMLMNTWYKITADGYLVVHCSIFPEKKLKVEEVTAVESTSMPVSSYALSLDRLIVYKEGKPWILISPVDKKEFVKVLRKHNEKISIKESDGLI